MRLVSFIGAVLLSLRLVAAAQIPTSAESTIQEIQTLVAEANNGGYGQTLEFVPQGHRLLVTLKRFSGGKTTLKKTFKMPCSCTFTVEVTSGKESVEVHAAEYWYLGPFDHAAAIALAQALTRLNNSL